MSSMNFLSLDRVLHCLCTEAAADMTETRTLRNTFQNKSITIFQLKIPV